MKWKHMLPLLQLLHGTIILHTLTPKMYCKSKDCSFDYFIYNTQMNFSRCRVRNGKRNNKLVCKPLDNWGYIGYRSDGKSLIIEHFE